MLWPHPYQLIAVPHRWTEEMPLRMTKQRSKLLQQWPSLPFVWRPLQLRNYQDCRPRRKLPCWTEGFSTSDLAMATSEHLLGFIGILYSSRLILLYSNHLEARQTIENHLVHMGTNLCRSMHIMTSSVAILVHFFLQFLFLQKQVYPGKLCTQWKFPAIRYRQNKTLEKHAWMTSICIWVKFKAWVVWLKLYKNWGFIVGRLILTLIYGTF